MGYSYQAERPWLFTAPGQQLRTFVRRKAWAMIDSYGRFTALDIAIGESWDIWHVAACLDRMIELGEIDELAVDRHNELNFRSFVAANTSIPDIHSMISIIAEFRDKTIA